MVYEDFSKMFKVLNCGNKRVIYNLPSWLFLSAQSSCVKFIHIIIHRSPELFQQAKLKSYIHSTPSHLPSPSPWPLPFSFLFLCVQLFYPPRVSEITQYLSFCDWLISLGIMSSWFICVVACNKVSFIFNDIPLYVYTNLVYPKCWSSWWTTWWTFGCFHLV